MRFGQIKQLSAQDTQFLYLETNKNHAHVTTVMIFDPSTAEGGKVRFKQIIEHVRSRMHTSPVYRRRVQHVPLELDFPYWVVDDDFDIEYHFKHARLPEPGDWRQFCIHLAKYHSRPLDLNRPPWEMYVVEGLGGISGYPEGAYALVTKVHHAAADGGALINFFGGLFDIDDKGTPVMPLERDSTQEPRSPNSFEVVTRGVKNNLQSSFKVGNVLMKAAPQFVQSAYESFTSNGEESSGDIRVPKTRFNQRTSAHKVFDATDFSLKEVIGIRALAQGCTVNDVVIATVSGALRRYLSSHHEIPDESLKALVPVNQRAGKGGIEADADAGNNISNMSVVLHTDIEDPVERLEKIYQTTQRSKQAKSGLSVRVMTDVSRHVPASTQLLASKLLSSSGGLTNLVVSNVPGPQVPVYMNGAKIVSQYALAGLGDKMGLFIATPSYNGRMTFSVTSSRDTLPDIRFFVECIEASFNELAALAAEQAGKVATKKKS